MNLNKAVGILKVIINANTKDGNRFLVILNELIQKFEEFK